MKIYSHYGFNEFVLCLGYRSELIKEYFLNYEAMNNDFTVSLGNKKNIQFHNGHLEKDFIVTLADTGLETMTGGRVQRVQKYLNDCDYFMLTYGDGLSDVDIEALVQFHQSHGKIGTVTAVRPISRFGVIEIDDEGLVTSFSEKPPMSGWISSGFFVFNKEIFDYLDGDECILEREPLERLAKEGQLMPYSHEGFFYAMDTYREYKQLNDWWDSGNAPWRNW
jgi:glucose-1-phosphate cytidylyltransferase